MPTNGKNEPLDEREILRIKAEANRLLSALVGDSVGALRDVLNRPSVSAAIRVQAAQTVLKHLREMEPEETEMDAIIDGLRNEFE